VQQRCELAYDDGDEMHYPEESSSAQGIAFLADGQPLEDDPDQVIHGISVHDWALKD
jgi:gluconate kinase